MWVYWEHGADGEELRYSMRSIEKNFVDLRNIVLCGDRPDWYDGDYIPSPKWTKREAKLKFGTDRWAKWTDSVIKLKRIIASPLVTDQFLWLYDDTFFMQPITAAEAMVPRRTGLLCANTDAACENDWRRALQRTAIALREAGRPALNYSHHAPVVYDKVKLTETIEAFCAETRPRAIESLYMNHHFKETDAVHLGKWMVYTQKPEPDWRPHPAAKVINVGGFRDSVEAQIHERFPERSSVEATEIPPLPALGPIKEFPILSFSFQANA